MDPFLTHRPPPIQSLRRFLRQANPWMLIALLAIAGWTLDSLLVALSLHQVPGVGIAVHFTHLWWGPPVLLAALWLGWRGFARWVRRKAPPPTVEHLASELPPVVQALAQQIVAAPTQAALLVWFRAYPTTAHLPDDLAQQIGQPRTEVETALAALGAAGLLEPIGACDLMFYRLTRDPERLQCLAELAAWQTTWLEHSRGLLASVGVPSQSDPLPRQDG